MSTSSAGVMLGMVVSLLICFALPTVPFILMQVKKQRIGRAFLFGALAFCISQLVLRIPLLQLASKTLWFNTLSLNPVLQGLFLGVTAGLFEEVARFIACKWILKRNRRYIDAIAFGFGHGGIEAILLIGTSLISSLVLYAAMQNGTLESIVGPQADIVAAQFAAITPFLALLGGVERILAVSLHVGLSVMVFAGFVRNKPWQYLIAAILVHAAVDAAVVILPQYLPIGPLGLEAIVAVFSGATLWWALRAKRLFVQPETEPGDAQEQSLEEPPAKEE